SSNTLMFAEGYSKAGYNYYYDYSAYYGPGSYYKSQYTYTRQWNYDPMTYEYESTSRYQSPNRNATPPVPYIYESTGSSTQPPYFYTSGYYDSKTRTYIPFQVKPRPDEARYSVPHATTSGGLLVALCDGSVRTISPGINITTWRALGSPASGDQVNGNW
ncbi:MAG: hypothetical protein L0241_11115, partial [Planctomycetia bacterium]|nr:hypothetical protein [Planctomycetia bacterium]